MNDIFTFDPLTAGTKGLVYIGDKILVYRRSHDAPTHPDELDFPGGGPEPNETPFQTFQREVYEEFQLKITEQSIVYARRYPSVITTGKFGWFPVAKLPASAEKDIVFGNEGAEWMLMTPQEFLNRTDSWTFLQDRTADYLATAQGNLTKRVG